MRGKNIIWISWIAILFSVGMLELGFTTTGNTKIMVDPLMTSGLMPGDMFWININIENAENLYGFQVKLQYQPVGSIIAALAPSNPMDWDGGFLGGAPYAFVAGNIISIDGVVTIIGSRLAHMSTEGVSGNGMLAKVKFVVIEAGESPIELFETQLLDFDGNELPHQTRDGFYAGPTADLIMANPTGRSKRVGQTANFRSSVRNDGDVPLYVKVRFDMVREEPLTLLRLGAGQSFTGFGPPIVMYLYANEYNEWLEWDWNNPGASLLGTPDGDYAYTNIYDALSSIYGFEDLTLQPGQLISNVQLEGYINYADGPDGNLDLDMLARSVPGNPNWGWVGSLYGGFGWDWYTPRWIGTDLSDELPSVLTEEGLNNLELILTYWTADHLSHTEARVDAFRLRVQLSQKSPVEMPVYVVQPGEEIELDPSLWTLTSYDVGKYQVTATLYFSYGGTIFNRGQKTSTFSWWVKN